VRNSLSVSPTRGRAPNVAEEKIPVAAKWSPTPTTTASATRPRTSARGHRLGRERTSLGRRDENATTRKLSLKLKA
jgi:hypothetical protein